MFNHEKDKNRIIEVIIIKGVKYIKNAVNSKLVASQIALRGSNVNFVAKKFMTVRTGSKYYF